MLGGTYGKGVIWNKLTKHTKCVACILGKIPRAPYSANGLRAAELLGLLHIDICGPFLVQGPKCEQYFIIALNDHSNDATVECLRTRDQAYSFYVFVEAKWERQTGKRVKAVHLDGAKELVEGQLGAHFQGRGIVV